MSKEPKVAKRSENLQTERLYGDAHAIDMIDHISNRLDNIIRCRNDTVHRLWFIGYGIEETKSYEVAGSIKGSPDIGKRGRGGVKYTDKDTRDFEEVIGEMQKLTALVSRFMVCVVMPIFDTNTGKPTNNFHYDGRGQLIDAPPPSYRIIAPRGGGHGRGASGDGTRRLALAGRERER